MRRNLFVFFILVCCLFGLVSACNDAQGNGAAAAVGGYLEGLVDKDADKVVNASCLAWEDSAQAEIDSFMTVNASLEDVVCRESGIDGNFTLVTCTGNIVFSYGDENQYLGLQGQTYLAVEEGGEWRMCGYR